MTIPNAIAQVKRDLPSEFRIHPATAPAVRELLAFAETGGYRAIPSRDSLVDALTSLIDEAIRKQRFSTYDDWQGAVEKLLAGMERHLRLYFVHYAVGTGPNWLRADQLT